MFFICHFPAASEEKKDGASEAMEVTSSGGADDTSKPEESAEPSTTTTADGEKKEGTADVKDEPLADRSTPPGGDEGLSQDSIKSDPDADSKDAKEEVKGK